MFPVCHVLTRRMECIRDFVNDSALYKCSINNNNNSNNNNNNNHCSLNLVLEVTS